MSQITLQGKQQALMRVAASRVAMLDAVSATRGHAVACVNALPVSPATVLKLGAAAGAAASVMGAMAGWRRKKKVAEQKAVKPNSSLGMLLQLALQLATPVLLPRLQQYLQKSGTKSVAPGCSMDL